MYPVNFLEKSELSLIRAFLKRAQYCIFDVADIFQFFWMRHVLWKITQTKRDSFFGQNSFVLEKLIYQFFK